MKGRRLISGRCFGRKRYPGLNAWIRGGVVTDDRSLFVVECEGSLDRSTRYRAYFRTPVRNSLIAIGSPTERCDGDGRCAIDVQADAVNTFARPAGKRSVAKLCEWSQTAGKLRGAPLQRDDEGFARAA